MKLENFEVSKGQFDIPSFERQIKKPVFAVQYSLLCIGVAASPKRRKATRDHHEDKHLDKNDRQAPRQI